MLEALGETAAKKHDLVKSLGEMRPGRQKTCNLKAIAQHPSFSKDRI